MINRREIHAEDYRGPDRRTPPNGNGRDWTSLRAWAQAIGFIGIPGAIAIWLVYIGSTELPKLARGQVEIATELKLNTAKMDQLIEQTNSLIRVTQRACSNAAKDDNARQKCFDR